MERSYFLYTRDKKPISLITGSSKEWNRPENLATYEAVQEALKQPQYQDCFMGYYVELDHNVVVIDIDEPMPDYVLRRLIMACDYKFGQNNYFLERSISGEKLHLIVRVDTDEETLRKLNRTHWTVLGHKAEVFTDKQGILITGWTLGDSAWITEQVFPNSMDDVFMFLEKPLPKPKPSNKASPNNSKPLSTQNSVPPAIGSKTPTLAASLPSPQKATLSLKAHHAWTDWLPLFPDFWRKDIEKYIAGHGPNDRLRLVRPGKDKRLGHSATLFESTGVFYNFSTNWHGVPLQKGVKLAHFIAVCRGVNERTLARQFHRHLRKMAKRYKIPIPKRKNKQYFRLKKRHFRMAYILLKLAETSPLTIQQISGILQEIPHGKCNRTSILRMMQILEQRGFVRKNKTKNKNIYELTENASKVINEIKNLKFCAIGYDLLIISSLLDSFLVQSLISISGVKAPPYVYFVPKLHTSRGLKLWFPTPIKFSEVQGWPVVGWARALAPP